MILKVSTFVFGLILFADIFFSKNVSAKIKGEALLFYGHNLLDFA
jgi:hypothetical protein